jgi:hypothetical protein
MVATGFSSFLVDFCVKVNRFLSIFWRKPDLPTANDPSRGSKGWWKLEHFPRSWVFGRNFDFSSKIGCFSGENSEFTGENSDFSGILGTTSYTIYPLPHPSIHFTPLKGSYPFCASPYNSTAPSLSKLPIPNKKARHLTQGWPAAHNPPPNKPHVSNAQPSPYKKPKASAGHPRIRLRLQRLQIAFGLPLIFKPRY